MAKETSPYKVKVSGCPFGGCTTCDEQADRIKELERTLQQNREQSRNIINQLDDRIKWYDDCDNCSAKTTIPNRGLSNQSLTGCRSKKRIEELEEGIELYIEINRNRQFTKPEIIKKIGEITGIDYKEGHIISAIMRDLEQVLKG